MTTTTPHPTARELAEKAAGALVAKGAIRYPYAGPECATIILRETKLEALLKCVEALRGLEGYADHVGVCSEDIYGKCVCGLDEADAKVIAALRELDQTKGDA